MDLKPNILVLVAALALFLPLRIEGQTTSPPYLSQFPSLERIKADVKGVDAMDTAAKQAGIFWQLRQLIYDLALSQRRTDRQFTPDEQRLEVEFRNAHYSAIEPFEGKVTGADKPKWFELRGKYEMDLWLRDEVFKKYFTPDLRRAVYVALKGQMPTTNAPEGSRLTPSAASLAAAARPSTNTATSMSQPSTSASLSAEAYADQGFKFFEAKDYSRAIEAYKKAVAANPSLKRGYIGLARAYEAQKQWQPAIANREKLMSLDPTDAGSQLALANDYFFNQGYQRSIAASKQYIALRPGDALGLLQLAVAYRAAEQFPEAVEAFRGAIRLNPEKHVLILLYNHLGYTYLQIGRKEDALQVYQALKPLDAAKAQELYAAINKTQPSTQSGTPSSQSETSKPDTELERLRARAERGSAMAQNSLGSRYERGKGVPADKTEARKWYLMAANQGDGSGKVNLCDSYADELHLSDDSDDNPSAPIRALTGSRAILEEAMRWCGVAANIGVTGVSKYKLGMLYAKGGPGVKPNYEEAYFWMSMSKGEDVFRDKVGKKLTREMRAEIEERAKAWMPRAEQNTAAPPASAPAAGANSKATPATGTTGINITAADMPLIIEGLGIQQEARARLSANAEERKDFALNIRRMLAAAEEAKAAGYLARPELKRQTEMMRAFVIAQAYFKQRQEAGVTNPDQVVTATEIDAFFNEPATGPQFDAFLQDYSKNSELRGAPVSEEKRKELRRHFGRVMVGMRQGIMTAHLHRDRKTQFTVMLQQAKLLAGAYALEMKARFRPTSAEIDAYIATHSEYDTKGERAKIDAILARIRAGEDFAKLADEFTEDPAGKGKGGDLGWFGRGTMVKSFEDAVFSLKPGELSGVIETVFGFYIVKLEGRRKQGSDEEVHARHILIPFKRTARQPGSAMSPRDKASATLEEEKRNRALDEAAGLRHIQVAEEYAVGTPPPI